MTGAIRAAATESAGVDLRRAALGDLRNVDLRAASRDVWDDERALWDRLLATWAGLDEAAWHLPGAAPSDAGGPDWSLAEHVGHLADWQELAIDYIGTALQTGRWPSDDDYDGGDFDRFNERRRAPWTTMPRAAIIARLGAARPRLLEAARRLSLDVLRGDDAWGWVYMTLHGHYLDHLGVIEPWADQLRARQVDGDPFIADPRPADHAGLAADIAAIDALFDELIRPLDPDRWLDGDVTPGWTLRDHVGHLADWLDEGVRAIDVHRDSGVWLSDPEEGIDAWNERHVAARRDESAPATLSRYDAAHRCLREAADSMSVEELRSPDGWSWVYDCHHGHVRKHLAMIGRWSAATSWPHP
ncbi:MAG TPA: maleylpyruvate isomerase N-terminal domain-containing protein [Candidatus Limnocylindrales bacterium]|nr:maleylpyruvate isomerase N-terminal domain-containing protein [Candidatus Limnocylindrales bacterium]